MKKLVFVFFAFASCSYNHTKTSDYTYYYDEEKGLKKIEGSFIDNQESGEWFYYSEEGEIVQQGKYQFGLPLGEWQYRYPDLDTNLIWKEYSISNLSFSLPNSYSQIFLKNDTINKYFSDTSSHGLVAIRIINNADSNYLNDFFKSNLSSFMQGYKVENSKSEKIFIQNQKFYIDEFTLEEFKDSNNKMSQILLYKKIDPYDKLFVLGITSRKTDNKISKFLLQEIFYHFKIDNKRIINIYDGFDVIGNNDR